MSASDWSYECDPKGGLILRKGHQLVMGARVICEGQLLVTVSKPNGPDVPADVLEQFKALVTGGAAAA